MTGAPPARPKIYHIIHVDRLGSIVADNKLFPDAVMVGRTGKGTTIGMSSIKQRRLVLPVDCHPGTCVGDYVPFYFCPRSIMLYIIRMANHAELTYRGGQGPIVHLEADLQAVVAWAERTGRRWAFSQCNASAHYAQFRSSLDELGEVDWQSVQSTDFRSREVHEGKQAEFLMHGAFPWQLIERVGVISQAVARQVVQGITGATHRPGVEVKPGWYY